MISLKHESDDLHVVLYHMHMLTNEIVQLP